MSTGSLFIESLGWTFAGGFTAASALTVYGAWDTLRFSRLGLRQARRSVYALLHPEGGAGQEQLDPVLDAGEAEPGEQLPRPLDLHTRLALADLRGEIRGRNKRTLMILSCIPAVALVGTVSGFYYALESLGTMELGSSDPIVIIQTLMAAGVAGALSTTVAGQGLKVLLVGMHAMVVATPMERALSLIDFAMSRGEP